MGSRNSNYSFISKDSKYLIKQVRAFDEDKIDTLHREACIYYLANETDYLKKLQFYLPRFYNYNYEENILVLEFLQGSKTLHEIYYKTKKFHPDLSSNLGKSIASYYTDLGSLIEQGIIDNYFREKQPWIFNFGRNHRKYYQLISNADHILYDKVSKSEIFKKASEEVNNLWQKNSLIHGDIKWVNFLETDNNLKIIDWEIADLGDIWWDVAGALHSILVFWMYFRGKITVEHIDRFDSELDIEIEKLVSNFVESSGLPFSDTNAQKLIIYTGFRLLQTALEVAHNKSIFDKQLEDIYSMSSKFLENPVEAKLFFLKFKEGEDG